MLSLAGAATSTIFDVTKVLSRQTHVCHDKHIFCCDKSMLAATKLLFVATKLLFVASKLLRRQMFVATNTCLSRQAYFCRNQRRVLSWQTCACRNKSKPVVTKLRCLLSWQKYVLSWHAYLLSRQKLCFVMTNTCLLPQKLYLWQLTPVVRFERSVAGFPNGQHFSLFPMRLAGGALWPADVHAGVPRRHQERGHHHQHPHAEENQSVAPCSHERWWDGGTGLVRFFVSALLVQLVGFF